MIFAKALKKPQRTHKKTLEFSLSDSICFPLRPFETRNPTVRLHHAESHGMLRYSESLGMLRYSGLQLPLRYSLEPEIPQYAYAMRDFRYATALNQKPGTLYLSCNANTFLSKSVVLDLILVLISNSFFSTILKTPSKALFVT